MADATVEEHVVGIFFSGIQAAGGAALAVYTFKNSANPIWSIAYSGAALSGALNAFKDFIKIFQRPTTDGRNDSCAVSDLVTGTLIYFGSLYGLSEAWKFNNKHWILCLATAVCGSSFANASLYDIETSSALEPHLKFCQLAFEPALFVFGTIYLVYFRNHNEGCLFWMPVFKTGLVGLKTAIKGFSRQAEMGEHTELLLKVIEIAIGGLILTISSTVLAIYGSWRNFMIAGACIGVFKIYGSIVVLMQYFDMEEDIRSCFGGMITGHILFMSGCLLVKCRELNTTTIFWFLLLTGTGHGITLKAFLYLHSHLPRRVFNRYCQRVLGFLLSLYSSEASAYIGHKMGWQFSLPTMALVPVGAYIAIKG